MTTTRRCHPRLLLIAVLLAAACSSSSENKDKPPAVEPGLELTLPRAQPKVGEQELKVTEMRMQMRFDVQGRKVESSVDKRTEELLKVAAVDGFAVSEAEVTYKRIRETSEMAGNQETKADPRAGKSYRVAREHGVLVARPLGGPATDEELEEVVDDNDEIGVPSEIDAIVASKTWRSGQPIAFTADEIARVNASKPTRPGDDQETMTAMELTLRARDAGVATFDLTMGMRIDADQGYFTVTLRGEARIDVATGRVLELGGTGALAGKVQGMPLDGSMTTKVLSRWVTAP